MADLWFYTTDGKQMSPVPLADLQQLAGAGTLKATDMVWTEGMAKWMRASTVKELYPETAAAVERHAGPVTTAAEATSAVKVVPVEIEEVPSGQRRRRMDDDDLRPAGRRRAPGVKGSSTGIIIALFAAAVILVGALGIGVFILISLSRNAPGKINPNNLVKGEVKYDVVTSPGNPNFRSFSFRKGVEYEFIVKTQQRGEGVDIDIHIHDASGMEVKREDLPDPDCYLRWSPQFEGEFRVEIRNADHKGRIAPINSTVTIREFKERKIEEPKEDPDKQPLPPDTFEGKGFKEAVATAKKEEVLKFRVKKDHKATFDFVPANPGPKTDFNVIIVKDSDPNQVIAKDDGPEARARVSFTLQTTEIVRVRIINASPPGAAGGSGKGILNYDVSR